MKRTGLTIIITALITAGAMSYLLSSSGQNSGEAAAEAVSGKPGTGGTSPGERKIIYWRAPMDPMEIYDEPGKSKMGMDLVPVYEDEAAGDVKDGERKIVYWKAPMDPTEIYEQPGKSKMGMDLVPVYEDELVGGVDIKIDPVVEQNMGLKTEPVERGHLNHTITTYGRVTFDETKTGIISQKSAGWIDKLHASYTGFKVNRGEPLYEIYSPALLASQEEYLSAFKNYKTSRTPLNKNLLDSARKRLEYFDIAPTEIERIEETGTVQRSMKVRSPFQGVVTHKNVVEGAYVNTGASLFTIADLSTVWVEAHIFEYEQNLVRVGQTVTMSLSYNPDKVYTGKISYIFPYLRPKTRDVVIRMSFDNKDDELKPDMFARIKIETGRERTGLSIPSQSIIHSGDEKLVFVAGGSGRFTPRQITTGISLDRGRVQVLSGLTHKENIVVSGQFLLDSESKLKEAIQKMIQSQSGPAREGVPDDDFFDDMDDKSQDDFSRDENFFEDMG